MLYYIWAFKLFGNKGVLFGNKGDFPLALPNCFTYQESGERTLLD
jgi:hypothetical protein